MPNSNGSSPPAPSTPGAAIAPAKRTQMADLARLAGVSASTVSRALSGHPAIAQQTRERITELARSLNYQVNAGAASLRKRSLQTVGVVMLNDSLQHISDPFILKLLGDIADQLDRLGIGLLLRRCNPQQPEDLTVMVDAGQASGLIVIGQSTQHQAINSAFVRGVPLVVWGARVAESAYPVVGSDNEQGGYLATRHLLEQGCRRISFIGEHHHPEAMLRHRGYQRALREWGLGAAAENTLETPFGASEIRQLIARWLDQGPDIDGLFCVSDVCAINAIAELTDRGVQVPQQVKVVGYDDIALAAYIHPPISSICQPTEQAAEALVQGLMRLIGQQAVASVLLPTRLIARESSTGPAGPPGR